MDVDERRASRKLRELAEEPAGGKRDDRSVFPRGIGMRDVQSAGENHGHAVAALADAYDRLTGSERTHFAEPADAVDLDFLEHREALLATAVDHGVLNGQHTIFSISSVTP